MGSTAGARWAELRVVNAMGTMWESVDDEKGRKDGTSG